MSQTFQISRTAAAEGAVLRLAGRIDSSNAAEFEQEVLRELAADPSGLILDMAELGYISSAGLRVILVAARAAQAGGQGLILCALAPNIRDVFDVSGFSAILPIADDADEARRRLAG